jgi:hypothetical protein
MADDYNPNDFEWRFQQTLKEHREKLDALPSERRTGVEEGLRRRFEEHEKGFFALDGHENYFEELDALFDKQDRETAAHVDKAQEAWGRFQDQQKGADHAQDHDKEWERE